MNAITRLHLSLGKKRLYLPIAIAMVNMTLMNIVTPDSRIMAEFIVSLETLIIFIANQKKNGFRWAVPA